MDSHGLADEYNPLLSPVEEELLRRDKQIEQSYDKLGSPFDTERNDPSTRKTLQYPDDLTLQNPTIYPGRSDLIIVQNPVAQVNSSTELPNQTEHVPLAVEELGASGDADEASRELPSQNNNVIAADYGSCEIYVPKSSSKKNRRKEPLKPDEVLTDGTEALNHEVANAENRLSLDMHNLVTSVSIYQQREKSYQDEIRKLSSKLTRLEQE